MKSNFFSKVIILASGTAGAQALSLVVMPFVTRIYSPLALGELALFTTIIALFYIFVSLGLSPAIIVIDDSDEVKKVCSFIFFVSVALLIFLIFLALLINIFVDNTVINFISKNFVLIALATITLVLFNIYKQYAIRLQNFKKISKSIFFQSLTNNFLKLSLGFFLPSSITLITCYILSYFLNFILLKENIVKFLHIKDFKIIFNKYVDYPKFRMPQMFINSMSEALPVVYLTHFYDLKAVGIYSLTRLTLGAPIMILGQTINDIFISKFARDKNKKDYLKLTILLILLGALICIFVNFFGNFIYKITFGDEWVLSGTYAAWVSFWMLSYLSSRPAVSAVAVLNFQRDFLIFEVVSIGLKIFSLYMGYILYQNALMSIAFFSMTSMILYFILSFLIYRKI